MSFLLHVIRLTLLTFFMLGFALQVHAQQRTCIPDQTSGFNIDHFVGPVQSTNNNRTGGVLTIPVVVHVVLNSAQALNSITDNDIFQQLQTLNDDFRRRNADTVDTRSIFKPVAADVEIEFCLAVRDTNNQPTTGITRTIGTTTTPWNQDDYLNIYIANIAPLFSYAYLPGGQGLPGGAVTLDYQLGFGPNERELTHAVGHFLGLSHTWGNIGGCSDDDGISDTPLSDQPVYGCDISANTCTENPDLPDQIENYMGYADCVNMFTIEQAALMMSVLTTQKSSLLSSRGCELPTPTADFSASATTICSGDTVSFPDSSSGAIVAWYWSFPGGTPSLSNLPNPAVSYNAASTYDITLIVTDVSGISDSVTKINYITILPASAIQINSGWNLISSYLTLPNPYMVDVFRDISSEILLVKNSNGQTYIPSLNINSIGDWIIEEGYKVKASVSTILELGCEQVDPTATPIQLNSGWNIIAYLRNSQMSIDVALNTISTNTLLVKDGFGKSYIPAFGINTIGNMIPGQGYKIKMSNAAVLVYPGN